MLLFYNTLLGGDVFPYITFQMGQSSVGNIRRDTAPRGHQDMTPEGNQVVELCAADVHVKTNTSNQMRAAS